MGKSLVLIQALEDLTAIQEELREHPEKLLLVVANNAAAATLEKLGVPFHEEASLLDIATSEQHLFRAPTLSSSWTEGVREAARNRGLGELPDFSAELNWPIELSLNTSHVYGGLLANHDIDRVVMFAGEDVAMLRNGPAPGFIPAFCITRAVVRFLAEQRGIPVDLSPASNTRATLNRPWRPRLALYDRATASPTEVATRFAADRPTAILWREGMWQKEIDAINAVAGQQLGWNVLELSQGDLDLFAPVFDSVAPGEADRFNGELRATLDDQRASASSEHPELFGNPYLRFQFEALAREIGTARRLQQAFRWVVGRLRPEAVFFAHDAFTVERAVQDAAIEHGVATISLFHGGLAPLCGCVGLIGAADVTAVWNRQDCERLSACGFAGRDIAEVGGLRFWDRYEQFKAGKGGRATPQRGKPTTVLVLTSPPHVGLTFRTTNDPLYRRAWEEIVRIAQARDDLSFVIRPHPAYDQVDYFQLIAAEHPAITVSSEGDIQQALQHADAALLMNACSTAALEAMFARVPLLFVTSALEQSAFAADQLRASGISEAPEIGQLESVLDALLYDAEQRTAALQRDGDILAALVGDDATPPATRLEQVIRRVARTEPDRASSGSRKTAPLDRYRVLKERVVRASPLALEEAIVLALSIATWSDLPADALGAFAALERDLRAGGQPANVRRQVIRAGILLAIRKRLQEKRWDSAGRLTLFAMTAAATAGSREYWSLALKSLVVWHPLTHRIGNWVDRRAHAVNHSISKRWRPRFGVSSSAID